MAAANIAAAFSFRCVATHIRGEVLGENARASGSANDSTPLDASERECRRVGNYSRAQVLALDGVFAGAYFPRLHNDAPLRRIVVHRAPLSAVATRNRRP